MAPCDHGHSAVDLGYVPGGIPIQFKVMKSADSLVDTK